MYQERQLESQHEEPAGEAAPGDCRDIHAEVKNQQKGGQKPHSHVDDGTDQGDLQVSVAAEVSLDDVGQSRKSVHQADQAEVGIAFLYDRRVFRKQKHGGCRQEGKQDPCTDPVSDVKVCSKPEAIFDPFPVSCSVILRDHRSHGIGDAPCRDQRKVIDPVCGCEGSGRSGPEGIDDSLDTDDPKLHGRLLYG